MSNVIALEHLNGTIVSILVSKTTSKYRLQSDSLPALTLLVGELQLRLHHHFSGSTNLQVGLDSPLPAQELWCQVETHFITYTELKRETVLITYFTFGNQVQSLYNRIIFQNKLDDATRQFQIIQRVFHNKILNTKTADLAQGTFSALQLAHDNVTLCIQKIERLQEVHIEANSWAIIGLIHYFGLDQ